MPAPDPDRVLLLLGTTVFGDLSPAEVEPLARTATIRRAVRGEHIFDIGDPADAVYVVASGQLRDAIYTDDGAEITHSLWQPGELLGEVGFFARQHKRVMALIALEPTTLVVIGREPLMTFLGRHPGVSLKLLEHVASTSQWQTGMLLTLARRPLADRVVLRLLDLAESSGVADERVATTPRLSQSTLASMVGASRENVNRALAALTADGTVRIEAGRFVIVEPDRVRLRIVADEPAAWPAGSGVD